MHLSVSRRCLANEGTFFRLKKTLRIHCCKLRKKCRASGQESSELPHTQIPKRRQSCIRNTWHSRSTIFGCSSWMKTVHLFFKPSRSADFNLNFFFHAECCLGNCCLDTFANGRVPLNGSCGRHRHGAQLELALLHHRAKMLL